MPKFAALLALLCTANISADVPSSSAALETIKALDTDGSGKVERAEVEAFARSQGLSAEEVEEEFKGLDKNGDGDLEPEELTSTLISGSDQSSANDVNEQKNNEVRTASESDAVDKSQHQATPEVEMKSDDHEEAKVHEEAKDHTELKSESSVRNVSSKSESIAFANVSAEVADMERDARLQAGRTLAQVFAHRAEEVLAQRGKDEEGAEALEKLAASLRQNATHLVERAPADAEQAAVAAADSGQAYIGASQGFGSAGYKSGGRSS